MKRGRRVKGERRKPEGVAGRSELREAFHEAWRRCGHPRKNKRCWKMILRRAWSDV